MPKVLVIDDSVSVRKVVERALAGRQIEVVCAASGTEALECIERDAPDVIVCDVVMPDRDGYEICDFVKNHSRVRATPVLLMSGIVNDEVRQRATRAGAEGVLSKPFAAEDLLKRLDGFLGPIAAKAPEPAAAPAVAMPTLMPVSALTVEPPVAVPPPAPVVPVPEPIAAVAPPLAVDAPAPPLDLAPPSARVAPTVEATPPALPVRPPSDGAAAILAQFAAMDGVQWAVLADREGFVVEATTNAGVDADVAAALSACLAESSDGLGRELGRGTLHGIILEYEKGMVVVYGAGPSGLLAVGLSESSVLGKVRYFAKKTLPELARIL
jgi:CheY-like chemotaxis protein/predicted regulator of Ras-like GTPase activity (Roadblock/LC7/MglB family)